MTDVIAHRGSDGEGHSADGPIGLGHCRLLSDPKARIYDFLFPQYVASILEEHCFGSVNHRSLIWSLLSFEWWLKGFFEQGHKLKFAEASI